MLLLKCFPIIIAVHDPSSEQCFHWLLFGCCIVHVQCEEDPWLATVAAGRKHHRASPGTYDHREVVSSLNGVEYDPWRSPCQTKIIGCHDHWPVCTQRNPGAVEEKEDFGSSAVGTMHYHSCRVG